MAKGLHEVTATFKNQLKQRRIAVQHRKLVLQFALKKLESLLVVFYNIFMKVKDSQNQ
jgi:hypothetical protein